MLDFLREEKISPEIIRGIEDFRRINGMSDNTAAEEIKQRNTSTTAERFGSRRPQLFSAAKI
ncbi:MAG: hypothetical protein ACLTK0_10275 [Anaerovoracaceae bacterium]